MVYGYEQQTEYQWKVIIRQYKKQKLNIVTKHKTAKQPHLCYLPVYTMRAQEYTKENSEFTLKHSY